MDWCGEGPFVITFFIAVTIFHDYNDFHAPLLFQCNIFQIKLGFLNIMQTRLSALNYFKSEKMMRNIRNFTRKNFTLD